MNLKKRGDFMEVQKVSSLKNLLEKKRRFLFESEAALEKKVLEELSADATGEVVKIHTHAADLATDTQEIEILESLSEKNLKCLQEINKALSRIEDGSYGLCQSCGDEIAVQRLEILPEARLCIECERDFEETHH
jgi:RNA polymerase-binding protein DksA